MYAHDRQANKKPVPKCLGDGFLLLIYRSCKSSSAIIITSWGSMSPQGKSCGGRGGLGGLGGGHGGAGGLGTGGQQQQQW